MRFILGSSNIRYICDTQRLNIICIISYFDIFPFFRALSPLQHIPKAYWYIVENTLNMTFSNPRRSLHSHSLVCSKNYLFKIGIGPIRDEEL